MTIEKIIFVPEARVTFTRDEVRQLVLASKSHYDGLCREQSQVGGLCWNLKNQLELSRTRNPELCLNFHRADLLAKVAQDIALGSNLVDVLNKLNEESTRINGGK